MEEDVLLPYSEEEVLQILEENLGQLVKVDLEESNLEILAGKSPSIYRHQESDQLIYIYLFDSLKARKEVAADIGYSYEFTGQDYNAANNAIIASTYSFDDPVSLDFRGKLSETVIKKFNPYQEAHYLGESENWTVQVKLGWYGYFAKEEDGTLVYESWSSKEPKLSYKEEADGLDFKYKLDFGSSSMGGKTQLVGSQANLGKSSGTGSSLGLDKLESLTFQIEWDGQEEEINLLRQE